MAVVQKKTYKREEAFDILVLGVAWATALQPYSTAHSGLHQVQQDMLPKQRGYTPWEQL